MVFHKLQLYVVKYEMQQLLKGNESNFQKLVITTDEYYKNRIGDNEICLNGKMYDIKSKEISSKKIELYLMHDSKEDSILDEIKQFLTQSNRPDKNFPDQVQRLITLNYLPPSINKLNFQPSFFIDIYYNHAFALCSCKLVKFSPPPKFS